MCCLNLLFPGTTTTSLTHSTRARLSTHFQVATHSSPVAPPIHNDLLDKASQFILHVVVVAFQETLIFQYATDPLRVRAPQLCGQLFGAEGMSVAGAPHVSRCHLKAEGFLNPSKPRTKKLCLSNNQNFVGYRNQTLIKSHYITIYHHSLHLFILWCHVSRFERLTIKNSNLHLSWN